MFLKNNTRLSNGWEYYTDDVYDGAPTKLTSSNSRNQITINEATSIKTNTPAGYTALWSSDAIQANAAGEAFVCRVDFKCTAGTVGDYAEVQWDIGGGGSIIVAEKTLRFEKVGDTLISETVALFTGSTFATNGCKLYLDTTSSGDTVDIFDIAILIQKVA